MGSPLAHRLLWAAASACAAAVPLSVGLALGWLPAIGLPRLAHSVLLQWGVLFVATAAGLAAGVTVSRLLGAARRAAEEREHRFRALLGLAADGYWEIDAHYRLTATADDGGTPRPLAPSGGLGSLPWQLPQWHTEAEVLDLLLAHLDRRQAFRDIALRWTGRSGRVRHYRASGAPRFDRSGVFTGYWGVVRESLALHPEDGETLAAEEALRRSEAMLSHLVATSPDLITLTDVATGRYAMVNRSFERISGWTAAEAVGRTAGELGVWGSDAARDDFVERVRREGSITDLPVTFIDKAGASFSMVVSAARFVMEHRDYLVINARDVTQKERERLEREAILLNASIGIVMTRQGRFVLVNRHFEQMFGCRPGELSGRPTAALWSPVLDAALADATAAAALARGEPVEMERSVQRKDGQPFLARIRGRVVDPQRPQDGGALWIVEDITDSRHAEQTLARARDDAESANRAKSAFLANTSHELRTPLNALIGLSRLARDGQLAEPQRLRYLEQIEHSAQSLAAIISDILDLSRIEAGKLPLEVAPFELALEIQALQRSGAVLAEGRPLTLRIHLEAEVLGLVQGDALRVRQIVSNYLGNAVKFTAQGTIWMRAGRPDGAGSERVRIEVEDTGPGIPAATLARLFKPFTQADDSTTRRYGGTGLGLSICQELAKLMGGRVGADSREGQGSLFWVELPLPAIPAAPALPLAHPPGTAPPLPEDPAVALAGLRVLIAEDNTVNMMIAVALLERWGLDVVQALDGREAVAAVQRAAAAGRPFDAVLMDVQMPEMSGHEATRALREREASGLLAGPLPIIALTAAALVSERDESLRAGMNDFLTKPIDADKLKAALRRWCTRPA